MEQDGASWVSPQPDHKIAHVILPAECHICVLPQPNDNQTQNKLWSFAKTSQNTCILERTILQLGGFTSAKSYALAAGRLDIKERYCKMVRCKTHVFSNISKILANSWVGEKNNQKKPAAAKCLENNVSEDLAASALELKFISIALVFPKTQE